MAYTPQLSMRGSATLRRIAWALGTPMTRAIEQVLEDSVHTVDKKNICRACRDPSICDTCTFYDKKNITPAIRLKDMLRTPPLQPRPDYNKLYKGMRLRVCMVREGPAASRAFLNSAEDVYRFVRGHLCRLDREVFISILLTTKNELIGVETVAVGAQNFCTVMPSEVFKSAILANAISIIVCHNHPSGDIDPSPQDIELTEKLINAGRMLHITVHDHIIVSHRGYQSLRDTPSMKGALLQWAA